VVWIGTRRGLGSGLGRFEDTWIGLGGLSLSHRGRTMRSQGCNGSRVGVGAEE